MSHMDNEALEVVVGHSIIEVISEVIKIGMAMRTEVGENSINIIRAEIENIIGTSPMTMGEIDIIAIALVLKVEEEVHLVAGRDTGEGVL